MRFQLAKPKSKIRKLPFELFGQPGTSGKTANEKCELIVMSQELCSRIPGYTNRVCGKMLLEAIPDRVHGRLNRRFEEPRNLYAVWENVWVLIYL